MSNTNNVFGYAANQSYVTTNTTQTIVGVKTFDANAIFNYDIYANNLILANEVDAPSASVGTFQATNGNITNFTCTNVNSALYSPSVLYLNGLNGISFTANSIVGMTINTTGQTYCAKTLRVDSDIRLLDVFTPGSGKQSQMYHTNTQLVLYNLENSGTAFIKNKNSTGSAAQGLLLSYDNATLSAANNPTMNGYTDPAATDSSNNIASTRWTQSAILAGLNKTVTLYAAGISPPVPLYYTLSAPLPQTVILKTDNATQPYEITFPNSSTVPVGSHIRFRKTYVNGGIIGNPWDVTFNITGGGYFVPYNALLPIALTFNFSSSYVYVDLINDGTFWCINNLV
jgi:hypothetical protein